MKIANHPTPIRSILLSPFSIAVDIFEGGGGTIQSSLRDAIDENSADAIESLVLAQACGGIDITSNAFADAIITAVESIVNHSDSEN